VLFLAKHNYAYQLGFGNVWRIGTNKKPKQVIANLNLVMNTIRGCNALRNRTMLCLIIENIVLNTGGQFNNDQIPQRREPKVHNSCPNPKINAKGENRMLSI
jgi:hypothetical protein